MFKRILSPWAVLLCLACGLANMAGQDRGQGGDAGDELIRSETGPTPLRPGESRLGPSGRSVIADANRDERSRTGFWGNE